MAGLKMGTLGLEKLRTKCFPIQPNLNQSERFLSYIALPLLRLDFVITVEL